MKYTCFVCNYETDNHSNFIHHNKTQKHIKNITQQTENTNDMNIENYICQYCNNRFSSRFNLTRHQETCPRKNEQIEQIKQEYEMQKIITELKNKNKRLEEKLKMERKKHNEVTQNLQKENEFYKKQLINHNNNNLASGSMKNTLNYLIVNFNNAPQLKALDDYSVLEEKTILMNNVIYHEDNETLEDYLGKFITSNYKTENPINQSIWNSDINRLTYINRENVNNNTEWIVDKKGIKMTQYIITPFLNYIKKISQEYANKLNKEIQEDSEDEDNHDKLRKINSLTSIINKIKTGELAKGINKNIAPHFQLENCKLTLCN